jgi:hypothetical protein
MSLVVGQQGIDPAAIRQPQRQRLRQGTLHFSLRSYRRQIEQRAGRRRDADLIMPRHII